MNLKKHFSSLVRIFSVLLLTLLVLEVATRIVLYVSLSTYFGSHIPEPYREQMKILHLYPAREAGWCKFDPLCYYVPREGFFRGPAGQVHYPKVKKGIRIICIGDSTTYGNSVDYYHSWPYLLEKSLKDQYRYLDQDIEVLNAGIPGASSRQVKRIFQTYLTAYDPDIVIWRDGFILSDHYEINMMPSRIRSFVWRCLYESRVFRVICRINDRGKEWKYETGDKVYDFIMYKFFPEKIVKNNEFNSDFSMVKKIALDKGITHVLAVDYTTYDREKGIRSDHEAYERLGIKPVVVTLNDFQKKAEKFSAASLFVDICHLTEMGEALIASNVFRFLVKEKWVEEQAGWQTRTSKVVRKP